jgi:hypothetical protein
LIDYAANFILLSHISIYTLRIAIHSRDSDEDSTIIRHPFPTTNAADQSAIFIISLPFL